MKKICLLIALSSLLYSDLPPPLPKNFSLFLEEKGIKHPVTTKNRKAAAYFNQGLTCLYAYNQDAAYWSFKKAVEIDPDFAMGYWGIAFALMPSLKTEHPEDEGYASLKKAQELMSAISANEKAYIEALHLRYPESKKIEKKEMENYMRAMEKISRDFPDDLDAPTLFADCAMDIFPNDWDSDGEGKGKTKVIAETLQSVLKRDPNHIGANHFYMHLIEGSPDPEKGLINAYRFQNDLLNSGHILHMPSHIFIRTGDYHLAVIANEKAVRSDDAYIQTYGVEGNYPKAFLIHNLSFLTRSYCLEGNYRGAINTYQKITKLPTFFFKNATNLQVLMRYPLLINLQFHKWDELTNLAKPPDDSLPIEITLWHFGRAMGYASLGNNVKALEERDLFFTHYKELSNEPLFKIAEATLNAKMAEQTKDFTKTIEYLEKAVKIQDTHFKEEPSNWFMNMRGELGRIYLLNQNFLEAEKVFRKDLENHPRDGRALFGLLKSLEGQNKETDAYWIGEEFEIAWRYSDEALTLARL